MNSKIEKDEHLEKLWSMKEEKKDSLDDLKSALSEEFNPAIISELSSEELVNFSKENNKITLSKKGLNYARRIIRAHRIAERLIYDVLGSEFESGACEFEHTIAPELVDSICTLLGHPRECPHGMPIPEGECCQRSLKTAQSSVVPLTELEPGKSARVAYINCRNDQQLHKLDGLQIRPGVIVKLHQKYPSYVIECEGGHIALDRDVTANISVWVEPSLVSAAERDLLKQPAGGRWRRHWRRGFRRKKNASEVPS